MGLFNRGAAKLPPYLQLLKSIPLFANLTNPEFSILAQIIHEREYEKDEVVFDQGEEGLGMYIVQEGKVLIHRDAPTGRKELETVIPGAFFGELALLIGAPRSASATCLEPTRLLFFFRSEFLDILETHGRLGSKLSFQIALHTANRLRNVLVERDFV